MMGLFDVRASGGKSEGLLDLPKLWVPPFFTIGPDLHRRYAASGSTTIADLVDHAEESEIRRRIRMFGDGPPEDMPLIVRSDARGEGLEQRGMLRSFPCDGTLEGVLAAAREVFESSRTGTDMPVGLIIQAHCSSVLWGHLSNERRVAEEQRRWVCEMQASTQAAEQQLPKTYALRVERLVPASSSAELFCASRKALLEQLRAVGRFFYDRKGRRHLEWIWDAQRLWIVQSDDAPDPEGFSPETSNAARAGPIRPERLRLFSQYGPEDARAWQKLRCVQKFKGAHLPTTSLFVLRGRQTVTRLAQNRSIAGLSDDLRELTKDSLVIRTDIRGRTALFAPRTDTVTSVKTAMYFLRAAARDLLAVGVGADKICFIAHRFIPAAASAFSLATPSKARVRIDGVWGLPDGLEFCSHDSFEVDARNGAQLARRVRYKASFLEALRTGKWRVSPLGSPWDWKSSLDDSTLKEIAKSSSDLAKRLGRPVVIMWFAAIPPGSGHPRLIPWRYTTEDAPKHIDSAVQWHFRTQPFYVRNPEDIEQLRRTTLPISSVVLRPDGPHLRDESFLRELGGAVQERGLRIDLEGSPLSHAYYILRRTGAAVACVDPINPRVVRQKFEKLVRDRIPVQIRSHGERVETLNLHESELLDVLKAKLVEEALEVLSSKSPEQLQEEMADVYEVLRALARSARCSPEQVQRAAARKRSKVGGFGKGIVLVETEDTPLIAVKTEDGLFGLKQASTYSGSPRSAVAARRRPNAQHDKIIVPLIPSVPSRLRGPARVALRHLGLSFSISYTEKFVEIVLEKDRPRVDSAQMAFSF